MVRNASGFQGPIGQGEDRAAPVRRLPLWGRAGFCLLCLVAASFVLQGCAGRAASTKDVKVPDTEIAAGIKAGLAEAGFEPVRVFVLDGRATLSGFVPTSEAKQRMIALARGVRGVTSVIDDLQVARTME
jgi:hypothetical protein